MHYLYILYSEKIDKYYIGESPDIVNRLEQHNSHYFEKAFTKAADDWEIIVSEKLNNKGDAVYLEKFIKRMKSKTFIQKIIKDNDILADILSKKP
ncbi:GIY-YIG nuclease family protein [Maribacter chungangensis]|uniref:GIY-YIG nuclease family protein n=1 Tax=Maribacter chungangensis TaxID=1069117 RepID=A0ABW3B6G2_9FLAO